MQDRMFIDKNVYSADNSDSVQEAVLELTHWQATNFTHWLTLHWEKDVLYVWRALMLGKCYAVILDCSNLLFSKRSNATKLVIVR